MGKIDRAGRFVLASRPKLPAMRIRPSGQVLRALTVNRGLAAARVESHAARLRDVAICPGLAECFDAQGLVTYLLLRPCCEQQSSVDGRQSKESWPHLPAAAQRIKFTQDHPR